MFDERYEGMFKRRELDMRFDLIYSSGELARVRDVVTKKDAESEYKVIAINPNRNSVMLHNGETVRSKDLILKRRHVYSS